MAADDPQDPLAPFHPLVRRWFSETLGEPSAPQRAGYQRFEPPRLRYAFCL